MFTTRLSHGPADNSAVITKDGVAAYWEKVMGLFPTGEPITLFGARDASGKREFTLAKVHILAILKAPGSRCQFAGKIIAPAGDNRVTMVNVTFPPDGGDRFDIKVYSDPERVKYIDFLVSGEEVHNPDQLDLPGIHGRLEMRQPDALTEPEPSTKE